MIDFDMDYILRRFEYLSERMEQLRLEDYLRYVRNWRRRLALDFLSGVVRGIGFSIGFSVLGARIDGNTCYINLPQSCAALLPEDAALQQQIVQGLVRSLCSIRNVRQVHILIESERRDLLGSVDISQPLTPAT